MENDNLDLQNRVSNLRSDLTTSGNAHSSDLLDLRSSLSTLQGTLSDLVDDTPELGM